PNARPRREPRGGGDHPEHAPQDGAHAGRDGGLRAARAGRAAKDQRGRLGGEAGAGPREAPADPDRESAGGKRFIIPLGPRGKARAAEDEEPGREGGGATYGER